MPVDQKKLKELSDAISRFSRPASKSVAKVSPYVSRMSPPIVLNRSSSADERKIVELFKAVAKLPQSTIPKVKPEPVVERLAFEIPERVAESQITTYRGKEGPQGKKGYRGYPGKDAYTPVKGVDYSDGKDGFTPVKGVDYFDGEDGSDGVDGRTPIPGVDFKITEEETGLSIANKLNTLNEAVNPSVIIGYTKPEDLLANLIKELKSGKNQLEVKDIRNLSQNLQNIQSKRQKIDTSDLRWHGGGISNITGYIQAGTNITITGSGTSTDPYVISSTGGATLTKETPVGAVDDSNVTFTVTHEPLYISVNGAIYSVGQGLYTSYVAGTITLSSAVGTAGFITSYYNA